jgi:metal-responsive CopG/Arc/MetJ family transcriptional regulator
VWALVDIDIEPYMGKASKINVTLPNLLTKKIDDLVQSNPMYKSRSHFLQVAAAHEFERGMQGT